MTPAPCKGGGKKLRSPFRRMCYYDYVARKKQEQVWKYTKADTDECVRLPKVPADSVPDWEHEHAN